MIEVFLPLLHNGPEGLKEYVETFMEADAVETLTKTLVQTTTNQLIESENAYEAKQALLGAVLGAFCLGARAKEATMFTSGSKVFND